LRRPVAGYSWDIANQERARLLARHEHLTDEECFQVLDVINFAECP
jgi:hypothetical protein